MNKFLGFIGIASMLLIGCPNKDADTAGTQEAPAPVEVERAPQDVTVPDAVRDQREDIIIPADDIEKDEAEVEVGC